MGVFTVEHSRMCVFVIKSEGSNQLSTTAIPIIRRHKKHMCYEIYLYLFLESPNDMRPMSNVKERFDVFGLSYTPLA